MLTTGLARTLAAVCGLSCVLCLAASAPIFFSWAIDSTRPIRVAPLLLAGALLLSAGALFIIRRAALVWLGTRQRMDA